MDINKDMFGPDETPPKDRALLDEENAKREGAGGLRQGLDIPASVPPPPNGYVDIINVLGLGFAIGYMIIHLAVWIARSL